MFGLGPVLVVGFLAWCVRRRAVEDPRALPDYLESGSALVVYIWPHFLRKTGVHFSGKCSKARRSTIADTEDLLRDENRIGVRPAGAGMTASPEPRAPCQGMEAIGAEIDDVIDLAPSEYDVLSWPHSVPPHREFGSSIERDSTR
jgi:hypothetical protein